jgi:uncharacterized repeat protein (TIGR02543 family)
MTVQSYSGLKNGDIYTVVDGDNFSLGFTLATGYALKSVTANGTPVSVQSSAGYSFTLSNVTADATITILDSLIQWPVTAAVTAGIAESTIPDKVTYNTPLTFAFKVADGYHLPFVTVGNTYQTLPAPTSEGVYSFTFNSNVTEPIIPFAVGAYPVNVLPVEEDTYVGGGGSGNTAEATTRQDKSQTLGVKNTDSQSNGFWTTRRAYMTFNLPAEARALLASGVYNKVVLRFTSGTDVSLGTSTLEIRTVPDDLPAVALMTWSGNGENGANDAARGDLLDRLEITSLTANEPVAIDVTEALRTSLDKDSVRLQLNAHKDDTNVDVYIYSKDNVAGAGSTPNPAYIPLLVLSSVSTYTVIFNTGEGGSSINDQYLEPNKLVVKPADPTRASYIFAGWYTDATYTTAWNFATDKVNGDLTLYARWLEKDETAPAAPTGLDTTAVTKNSIAISWNAATDNVEVTAYEVFLNGHKEETTTNLSYTILYLDTLTTYSIEVYAIDAAGNRSEPASLSATTKGSVSGNGNGNGGETGIASASPLAALKLFPNPVVNGQLVINNEQLKAGDKVEIYTLAGTLVATHYIAAGQQTKLNVSSLEAGVYVVKVGRRSAKVLVMKN